MITAPPPLLMPMSITTIWYLMAMSGEMPDRICPVIMPGSETKPTAKKPFIRGISEALKAFNLAFL